MKILLALIMASLLIFTGCGRNVVEDEPIEPAPGLQEPADIPQPPGENPGDGPGEGGPAEDDLRQDDEPLPSPDEFTLDDFQFGILTYQDDPDDIIRKMGSPLSRVEAFDEIYFQTFLDMSYAGMEIRFEEFDGEYHLRHVSVSEAGIPGPRGIEVGMPGEQVLHAFPNIGLPRDDEQVLYGVPMSGNRGMAYWDGNELTDIFYVYEPKGWVPTVLRITLDRGVVELFELYLATI